MVRPSAHSRQRPRGPPRRLLSAFSAELTDCRPTPPPLRLEVTPGKTFSLDLRTMVVSAPPSWRRFRGLGAILRHEIKHASRDGQPHTYRRYLDHAAALMKVLSIGRAEAQDLLNVIYDFCVDRLVNARYSIKVVQEEWLKHFPLTEDAEGTAYHLLNIIYKDLFGVDLRETEYEKELKTTYYPEYKQLMLVLHHIGSSEDEEEMKRDVLSAAYLISRLIRKKPRGEGGEGKGEGKGKGRGGARGESGDEGKSRSGDQGGSGAPEDGRSAGSGSWSGCEPAMPQVTCSTQGIEDEVIEIALSNGLEPEQVSDLLGRPLEELDGIYEDCARKALWQAVAAYRGRGSRYAIQEPYRRRWKPWDREIDPDSIARHPNEPEKWTAMELQPTVETDQYGGEMGAESVAVAVDNSSSMSIIFAERTRLAWAKDAALGLIAFAKENGLPVECFSFSDTAERISAKSRDYLGHAKGVLALRTLNRTNPADLIRHLRQCDEGTLVAIITDGCFPENQLRAITGHVKRSKVICAVVDTDPDCEIREVVEPNLEIYAVKPSAAGATLVERAEKSLRLGM